MKSSNPDNIFRYKLKSLRESSNLTIDEFCKRYNAMFDGRLNKSTISRYENGLQEPMVSTVKKIAIFFNVDPSELLGYSSSENPKSIDNFPSSELQKLSSLLSQLNAEGREKLLDYADDLVSSGKYTKNSPVQLDQEA